MDKRIEQLALLLVDTISLELRLEVDGKYMFDDDEWRKKEEEFKRLTKNMSRDSIEQAHKLCASIRSKI